MNLCGTDCTSKDQSKSYFALGLGMVIITMSSHGVVEMLLYSPTSAVSQLTALA